ncbi:MAG: hypothetical protein QXU98_08340 [Candidatus Parvarchaeota archaeon]
MSIRTIQLTSNIEYGDAYIFFTCVYDSYNTIVSIVRPKNVPVPVRASASVLLLPSPLLYPSLCPVPVAVSDKRRGGSIRVVQGVCSVVTRYQKMKGLRERKGKGNF